MFGEIDLDGIKKLTLRKNGTITLPEFTKAELSENLYYLNLNNELRLYSEKEMELVLKKFEKLIFLKTDYKEARKLIRYLCANLVDYNKVLNQGRISIPQKFIENQKLKNEVVFVGSQNHAKIFKNMEEYQKYLEECVRNSV